jgi:hypothetical protein
MDNGYVLDLGCMGNGYGQWVWVRFHVQTRWS